MATNDPLRPSSSGQSPTLDPDDDDDISVTSTVVEQHDEDAEFEVEDLHIERTKKGVKQYLVEWTGFSIDQASWEPADNLGAQWREKWEEKKRKQELGLIPVFDLAIGAMPSDGGSE